MKCHLQQKATSFTVIVPLQSPSARQPKSSLSVLLRARQVSVRSGRLLQAASCQVADTEAPQWEGQGRDMVLKVTELAQ